MTWLIEIVIKAIAAFLAAIVSDKRVEKTQVVIQEIEDAQRKNDASIRDLGSTLDRLRSIRDAAPKP